MLTHFWAFAICDHGNLFPMQLKVTCCAAAVLVIPGMRRRFQSMALLAALQQSSWYLDCGVDFKALRNMLQLLEKQGAQIRSEEGLTLETSAPAFYLTVV